MGKDAKDVPKEKALEYVLGYTLSKELRFFPPGEQLSIFLQRM